MKLTLDDLVSEMLSFEKPVEIKNPNFFQRVHNFVKRQEIEKSIRDDIDAENQRILKIGNDAKAFLNSSWYRDLIEPPLRQSIKGGIQVLLRQGESMTESQIKSEIACINKSLKLIASIKLKVIQAESVKERMK